MSLTGRVETVRIQDENDSDELRTFRNVKLTLTNDKYGSELIITIPNEQIKLDLKDYSYVEESSESGVIECIRSDSIRQTVIIMDVKKQCGNLLDKMRHYLTDSRRRSRDRSPSPRRPHDQSSSPRHPSHDQSPKPADDKNVKELLKALNAGQEAEAAEIARALARSQQPVRFALNMINESGDVAPRPKPKPVVPPFKPKLAIESFVNTNPDNQLYDVSILPETTVENLKQIVQRNTGIAADQQYWYINRDLLPDNYVFGVSKLPRFDNDTTLILYIAKPQNS